MRIEIESALLGGYAWRVLDLDDQHGIPWIAAQGCAPTGVAAWLAAKDAAFRE